MLIIKSTSKILLDLKVQDNYSADALQQEKHCQQTTGNDWTDVTFDPNGILRHKARKATCASRQHLAASGNRRVA